DDVLLDLVRAAVDRRLAHVQVGGAERGGVSWTDRFAFEPVPHGLAAEGQGVRAYRLHHQLRDGLLDLGPSDLQQRGLGAGSAAFGLGGDHAQVGDLQGHQLNFNLRHARSERGILQQRTSILPFLAGDAFETRELALGGAYAGDVGALVAKEELRIGPAAILLTYPVLHRDVDVFEPDLVDLPAAVEQRDRPHRHAR